MRRRSAHGSAAVARGRSPSSTHAASRGGLVLDPLHEVAEVEKAPPVVPVHERVHHPRKVPQAVGRLADERGRAARPGGREVAVAHPQIALVEAGPDREREMGTELPAVLARRAPARQDRVRVRGFLDEAARERVGVGEEECLRLVNASRRLRRRLSQGPMHHFPGDGDLVAGAVHEAVERISDEPDTLPGPLEIASHPVEIGGYARQHGRRLLLPSRTAISQRLSAARAIRPRWRAVHPRAASSARGRRPRRLPARSTRRGGVPVPARRKPGGSCG